MIFQIVVNVDLIEQIWTFYIIFDAGASYVSAFTHKESPISIKISGVKFTSRNTLLL